MIYLNSLEKLSAYLKTRTPSLFVQSMTSTVIPFHSKMTTQSFGPLQMVNLSGMSKHIELKNIHTTQDQTASVVVRGPVTWKELKEYLAPRGYRILASPTEELASVLAGVATSCSGEHSFGFGSIREHILSCKYLDFDGDEQRLNVSRKIAFDNLNQVHLLSYQKKYAEYYNFKNAPFPRLEFETDLMVGSEGQLGVITEVELKVAILFQTETYVILLPPWEIDYESHLNIHLNAQQFKKDIISLEFLDSNSLGQLPNEEWSYANKHDALFLEIRNAADGEEIINSVLKNTKVIPSDEVLFLENSKYQRIRKQVPRVIQEKLTTLGSLKKGTDVQVDKNHFRSLFDYYRNFAKNNIPYVLFGHFGDAHLHFNFLLSKEESEKCDNILENFYRDISSWKASPFAEHGIGILKQKFIKNFWNEDVYKVFSYLKEKYDPYGQFFPMGYMSLKLFKQNI